MSIAMAVIVTQHADAFHSLNVLKGIPKDRFVDTLDEARQLAKSLLDDRPQ